MGSRPRKGRWAPHLRSILGHGPLYLFINLGLCDALQETELSSTSVDLHVIRGELYRLAGELRVKMLKIMLWSDIRLVGWNDLFSIQQRPVDCFEERMRLDISETGLGMTTKTLLRDLPSTTSTLTTTTTTTTTNTTYLQEN